MSNVQEAKFYIQKLEEARKMINDFLSMNITEEGKLKDAYELLKKENIL